MSRAHTRYLGKYHRITEIESVNRDAMKVILIFLAFRSSWGNYGKLMAAAFQLRQQFRCKHFDPTNFWPERA
jgi:hypothetical protein